MELVGVPHAELVPKHRINRLWAPHSQMLGAPNVVLVRLTGGLRQAVGDLTRILCASLATLVKMDNTNLQDVVVKLTLFVEKINAKHVAPL